MVNFLQVQHSWIHTDSCIFQRNLHTSSAWVCHFGLEPELSECHQWCQNYRLLSAKSFTHHLKPKVFNLKRKWVYPEMFIQRSVKETERKPFQKSTSRYCRSLRLRICKLWTNCLQNIWKAFSSEEGRGFVRIDGSPCSFQLLRICYWVNWPNFPNSQGFRHSICCRVSLLQARGRRRWFWVERESRSKGEQT